MLLAGLSSAKYTTLTPRNEGRHWPGLTKGIGYEEGVAMGQRERVAVGAKGPRVAENALGPKALVNSHD